MSERRYTYEVEVDTSSLAAAEAEIKRRLGGAMAQIDSASVIRRIDPRAGAGNGSSAQQERALLATHVETEKRMTAETRAEAKAREAIDRAASVERIEAARTLRVRATEEERRLTAEVRSQAYERYQAAAQGPTVGNKLMTGAARQVASAALGAVSIYGAMQAGQEVYEMGKQGAANQQLAASFDKLTKSVGLSGDALTQKLGGALAGTVSDMRLMSETNRLLLTAQNEGITVTEKQIETLGRFSRLRATQLTANGKPLGADEAYSRLITGVTKREMELLDELGISSKGLAAQLGVDVKDVNSSVESLLTAITRVAEAELASVGDPLLSDAEKIQKAETDIANAMDRLRAAAVEPVVFTVEVAANVVETGVGIVDGLRQAWDQMQNPASAPIMPVIDTQRAEMRQAQDNGLTGRVTDDMVADFQKMKEAAARYEQALEAVNHAEGVSQSRIFEGTRDVGERNAALAALHQTMTDVSVAYARLAQLEQAGIVDAAALAPAEVAWQAIVAGIADGSLELDDANAKLSQMLGLVSQIAPMIGPAMMGAAQGVGTWADGVMQNFAANSRQGPMPTYTGAVERNPNIWGGTFANQSYYYGARGGADLRRSNQDEAASERERLADAQFRLALTTEDVSGQLALYYKKLDGLVKGSEEELNLRTQIGGLEKQLANEQEAGAKRVEAEWKAAAEKTAQEFKSALSKIGGIPGVTGASAVTEEDMSLAKYGLYKDKPDEWLRKAEDELRNGKDHPGIERGMIEKMLAQSTGFGVDKLQAIPGDVLATLLNQEYSSSRIFDTELGRQNKELMFDPSAVDREMGKQDQEQRGLDVIMQMLQGQSGKFGFGAGTPGNLDAFLSQLTGEGGAATQINQSMAEATAGVGDMGRMALSQFSESNSMTQFYEIGKLSAGETFRGWTENIGSAPFAVAMAESIKQSIIAEFEEVFK